MKRPHNHLWRRPIVSDIWEVVSHLWGKECEDVVRLNSHLLFFLCDLPPFGPTNGQGSYYLQTSKWEEAKSRSLCSLSSVFKFPHPKRYTFSKLRFVLLGFWRPCSSFAKHDLMKTRSSWRELQFVCDIWPSWVLKQLSPPLQIRSRDVQILDWSLSDWLPWTGLKAEPNFPFSRV